MSDHPLPPPDPPACLLRLRSSSQKGGTLVVEDVVDWAVHERRIRDPDGYRPSACPRCGDCRLHVHDYIERVLRAEAGRPVGCIVRHECAGCGAVWRILPMIIARHLWRSWATVERVLMGREAHLGPASAAPAVPARTQRRWRARWRSSVRVARQVLATSLAKLWTAVSVGLPESATYADLVERYLVEVPTPAPLRLASVAALIYRLAPRLRLV